MDSPNSYFSNQYHRFSFREFDFLDIDTFKLNNYTAERFFFDRSVIKTIANVSLHANEAMFEFKNADIQNTLVHIFPIENGYQLKCNCVHNKDETLCKYQFNALNLIAIETNLKIAFDANRRKKTIIKAAEDFGLEQAENIEALFNINFDGRELSILPKNNTILDFNNENLEIVKHDLKDNFPTVSLENGAEENIIVLRKHKFYKNILFELNSVSRTQKGAIKNPISLINPLDLIWKSTDPKQIRFYTGLLKFQNSSPIQKASDDLRAIKGVLENPSKLHYYLHDPMVSESTNASSLAPINISNAKTSFEIHIKQKKDFFEMTGVVTIQNKKLDLANLELCHDYFLKTSNTLFLIDDGPSVSAINWLNKTGGTVMVHASKFEYFKKKIIAEIEEKVNIKHRYAQVATPIQLQQSGNDESPQKIIYLSDFGSHVMIIPVMQYGQVEIPVRSKKEIYEYDLRGRAFNVPRNIELEINFLSLIIKQNPMLEEQLEESLNYFYLHKKYFNNEKWFLGVFEEWQTHNIIVMGFGELEGIKINPHKAKVSIQVTSGLNWFNAAVEISYGNKKASLKNVNLAIKNKSKYIKLGDGTFGVLPDEWRLKFKDYFEAADEFEAENIKFSKSKFLQITQLFEDKYIDEGLYPELKYLQTRLANFSNIKKIQAPLTFNGTLRKYQLEGLQWLNFLEEFGFGGCLADDMGLGKTVQVLSFLTLLNEKNILGCNLLVVPTSLIFNWKQEIERFCPQIKVHIHTGSSRQKNKKVLQAHNIIICSYNVMCSDVSVFQKLDLNYVIIDEAQNIKNPESLRFKAIKLIESKNKLALTGTPVENNTFDLYSIFSFINPGFLGSKSYFRDIYSIPIDRNRELKRTQELQQKVSPFLLRRTKSQVAAELPEKTEMVIYCEMPIEQRKIYETYEKEFRELISASDGDEIKHEPMHVLKGLTKLRQICNAPSLIKDKGMSVDAGSIKIEILMEQLQECVPANKVLVFSQFVGMLDLIAKALNKENINYVMLTGASKNREAIVDKFQSDPEVSVFLISLKAGGVGLNLTAADYVFIIDPWWNPAAENQAIDRAHRIGQDKKVMAIRLICPNTVEEKIMLLQETKKELAENIIKEENGFIKGLNKKDLLGLLN